MESTKKKIITIHRRRLHKKKGKIILRENTKTDKEISKTLAHDRKRRKQYRKIPPTWINMGRYQWGIDQIPMAIWICIHRRIRKRKNNKLHYKIYNQTRRKTQRFYTYYTMQSRNRKKIP